MKTAKLFLHGNSQALNLPKEFQFEGDQVYIKKIGNALILLPVPTGWDSLKTSLSLFTRDFMQEREQKHISQ